VALDSGEEVTAHCANTGPMTGVLHPGGRVRLRHDPSPHRKLAYTWEMIRIDNTWVGVNTALPNQVIKSALTQKIFPELAHLYEEIKSEVPYGKDNKSRVDFLLTSTKHPPIYLEVKNTTLSQGSLALFPDTVTTRGQKHLQELTDLLPDAKSVMLYFINRGDCSEFNSGDEFDPTYGKLLTEGVKKGLMVLPCRFAVSPEGIHYLGLAKFVPS
jgi:sugar fermentation stimulation protein A